MKKRVSTIACASMVALGCQPKGPAPRSDVVPPAPTAVAVVEAGVPEAGAEEAGAPAATTVVAERRRVKSRNPCGIVGSEVVLKIARVEGPFGKAFTRELTPKALFDADDESLGHVGTSFDFTVIRNDARFLTVRSTYETCGAYPSTHVATRSFDVVRGAKIDEKAFLAAQRAKLRSVLEARVVRAWRDRRKHYGRDLAECGATGPDAFPPLASEDPPSHFEARDLASVFVAKTGVEFAFDFGLPHVVKACTPPVVLSMTAKEIAPYVDPSGPLTDL